MTCCNCAHCSISASNYPVQKKNWKYLSDVTHLCINKIHMSSNIPFSCNLHNKSMNSHNKPHICSNIRLFHQNTGMLSFFEALPLKMNENHKYNFRIVQVLRKNCRCWKLSKLKWKICVLSKLKDVRAKIFLRWDFPHFSPRVSS